MIKRPDTLKNLFHKLRRYTPAFYFCRLENGTRSRIPSSTRLHPIDSRMRRGPSCCDCISLSVLHKFFVLFPSVPRDFLCLLRSFSRIEREVLRLFILLGPEAVLSPVPPAAVLQSGSAVGPLSPLCLCSRPVLTACGCKPSRAAAPAFRRPAAAGPLFFAGPPHPAGLPGSRPGHSPIAACPCLSPRAACPCLSPRAACLRPQPNSGMPRPQQSPAITALLVKRITRKRRLQSLFPQQPQHFFLLPRAVQRQTGRLCGRAALRGFHRLRFPLLPRLRQGVGRAPLRRLPPPALLPPGS